MDKKMLQDTFRKFKKAATSAGFKIDYAITNPDGLGDCMSCVNYALCEKYGEDSKGVWVKEWTRGMNAGDGIEKLDEVYVAHDLDDVQVGIFYSVVGENFNILPKKADFDRGLCFSLYEKGTAVWSVSFTDTSLNNRRYSDDYTDKDAALRRVSRLCDCPHYVDITITKVF